MIQGSCLCGAVAFEADEHFEFRYCHCSRCRKVRGTAFAANIMVRPSAFRWLRGEDQLTDFRLPDTERFGNAFCKTCGSPMPREVTARNFVLVPAGSLDGTPEARPRYHIFAGSKAPWHEIADDLPQYEEYPPPTR